MFKHISIAHAKRRVSGILMHFTCKFSHKLAFLTCPSAFRLRRLAQNVGLRCGLRHFSCKFSHKMALVTCPSAFGLRRLTQNVGLSLGLRHFAWEFSRKMAFVACPCAITMCCHVRSCNLYISICISHFQDLHACHVSVQRKTLHHHMFLEPLI